MKILSLYTKNYKKLKHSNIKKLSWNINHNIQLILGTNGSGKSSLLQLLYPSYIPTKSYFDKNGKRTLIIEHNHNTYTLSSDFQLKSKVHSFKLNDTELNPGGGADIQKELIEKHFNLSPLINQILSLSINWSLLTPSVRKSYIYTLNPINIDLLVNTHKNIKKQLTKLKNNISFLNQRQQELQSKLLTKNEFTHLSKTKKSLDRLKTNLTSFQTYLNSLISNISSEYSHNTNPNISNNISSQSINQLITSIRSLLQQLNIFSYRPSLTENIQSQLSYYNAQLSKISSSISNLNTEIDKYNTHLKHLSLQDQKTLLTNPLKN